MEEIHVFKAQLQNFLKISRLFSIIWIIKDKFIALNGFKNANKEVVEISNPLAHLNEMPLFHIEQIFSSHIGGHLTHEEEFTHDEPYGYKRCDDPFDPSGKLTFPLLMFIFGTVVFVHFNFVHFNFFRAKGSEIWMHQRITAGMLEDKIRYYREEGAK